MKHRLPFALLILCGALAFSPAPLPRKERGRPSEEITIDTFQGSWRATSMLRTRANGQHVPDPYTFTHVRIAQDRWTFMTGNREGNTFYISIDALQQPAHLNFSSSAEKRTIDGVALIRRHEGKVQVLYTWGNRRQDVRSFDPAPDGFWLVTLEKGG